MAEQEGFEILTFDPGEPGTPEVHLSARKATLREAREYVARTPSILSAETIAIVELQTQTVECVRGKLANLNRTKGLPSYKHWKEGKLGEMK